MNVLNLNSLNINDIILNKLRGFNLIGTSISGGENIKYVVSLINGNTHIIIKDTKENSITNLSVQGGCYQSGTPTPAAPKSIITNKGILNYTIGNNLLEVNDSNIVVGKYINNAGVVMESLPNIYFQRLVSVKPSTDYTLSTSETLNYANFMEYDADGVFIKRTLYGSTSSPAGNTVTHTMGDTTAFVIIGSNVNSTKYPSITKDNVNGIKWMFNEGNKALKYEAYNGRVVIDGNDEISIYGKNLSVGELVGKGYASTGVISTSSTFCGNLYKIPVIEGQTYTASWGNLPDGVSGVFVNTWKTDGSWNMRQAISATDHLTYTIPIGIGEVNFTLYKTGGITIAEDSWLQVELGDTVTEYNPAIEPSKVSMSTLLGVGDFIDIQDATSGIITHKVGYKVLTGYEQISTSNNAFTIGISDKIRSKETLLCSHFTYSTATSSALANNTIIGFASQNVGFRNDNCPDIESFRLFLQMEYAKGTPVIVVYPLANENEENVTPQTPSNPKGDITIIRDAEIGGIEFNITLMVKQLQSNDLIKFTIAGVEYEAVEGMTWREWCESPFNPGWYYITGGSNLGGSSDYNFTNEFITDGTGSAWLNVGIFKQDKDLVDNYSESPEDVIIANYPYLHHA